MSEKLTELEERVEQLEEQLSIQDSEGREISVPGLLNMGLSRRQALVAIGLVASGAAAPHAIKQAISRASAGTGNTLSGVDQIGTSGNPVDTLYVDNLNSFNDTETFTDVDVTNLLDLPEYDDVSNAPSQQSSILYATGNGVSSEGIYRHNGTSYEQVTGALSDSGNDTDSGNDYQMPTAADNIDLQSDGEIRNAQAVSTDAIDTNRTWQDVVSSRSLDTQETNNTDSEIAARATADAGSDGTQIGLNFDVGSNRADRVVITVDSSEEVTVQAPAIPPGQTYEVQSFGDTANYSLQGWEEFRP